MKKLLLGLVIILMVVGCLVVVGCGGNNYVGVYQSSSPVETTVELKADGTASFFIGGEAQLPTLSPDADVTYKVEERKVILQYYDELIGKDISIVEFELADDGLIFNLDTEYESLEGVFPLTLRKQND